jgi:hypothetical protein
MKQHRIEVIGAIWKHVKAGFGSLKDKKILCQLRDYLLSKERQC